MATTKENIPQVASPRQNLLLRTGFWFARVIKKTVVFLAMLLLALWVLLQIESVQNWIANKTTIFLSNALKTTVSIDYLSINFFDDITLNGFYIEDQQGDTLLYSESLRANTNLFALVANSLVIEELSLKNAYFEMQRDTGELAHNFQFIIDYFSTDRKTKRPFYLDADAIYLDSVHFVKLDSVMGQHLDIFVDKGEIIFDKWDLPNKRLAIASVDFKNPDVKVNDFQDHPLPEIPGQAVKFDSLAIQDTVKFLVTVEDLKLHDGKLLSHNYRRAPVKLTPPGVLDLFHLNVWDIQLDAKNFSYSDWVFQGEAEHISLKEGCGLFVEHLAIKDGKVTPRRTELYGVDLNTPNSHVGDTVIFKYRQFPDFRDFDNKVMLDVRLSEDTYILTEDIMKFAINLENNAFFRDNKKELLKVEGRFTGRVNSLKGHNLDIRLADGTLMQGNFSSRNLKIRDEAVLHFQLDRFKSSMKTLRQLMPRMKLPENFDKLGRLDFSGQFDGFLLDFVAYGALKTNLGKAEMDMRLNLKDGRENASYSGELSLFDFDLAQWTDNPNFGKVTFKSKVENGVGLRAETARAELIANVEVFPFKGYTYENAILNGKLNKNLFDGQFNIKDDNIDLTFNGTLDFTDSIPEMDFQASVNKLALLPLNLSKKDFVLAGDIDLDLRHLDLEDLEGTAKLNNFKLVHDGKTTYTLDSIMAISKFEYVENAEFFVEKGGGSMPPVGNGDLVDYPKEEMHYWINPEDWYRERTFEVTSDLLHAKVVGDFNIESIPEIALQFLEQNYPEFTKRFNIKSKGKKLKSSEFEYALQIFDTKGWNYLADPRLDTLKGITLGGDYSSYKNHLKLELEVPRLKFDKIDLTDSYVLVDADSNEAIVDVRVKNTLINNKNNLAPIQLWGYVDKDTLDFDLSYKATDGSPLKIVDLDGKIFMTRDSLFEANFKTTKNSKVVIGNYHWEIDDDNYIRFGKGTVDTEDFVLTSEDKKIYFQSIGEKGLGLRVRDYDIHFVDSLWKYDPLDFYGLFDLEIDVKDIYNLRDISAYMAMDSFIINGDNYGKLGIIAETESIKHQVSAVLDITLDSMVLAAHGTYNPPKYEAPLTSKNYPAHQPNYLDFDLDVQRYPVAFLDYFIGHSISNTRGNFDIDGRLYGLPRSLETSGEIRVYDAAITIDYLNTTYFIDDQKAIMRHNLFDATGGYMLDELGNKAYVTGGITHENLRNLGFGVSIRGQRMLGLNTQKGDNPVYYGKAICNGFVEFSGSFKQPEIYINATTLKGSHLTMPVSYDQDGSEVKFIRFVKKEEENEAAAKAKALSEFRGLSLKMDLEITPDAEMQLIFDEQAGDILKGTGRGNVQLYVPRLGDYTMYGDVEIESGEYLFTMLNLVNKPFTVKKGGTILWDGDPFNANINITTVYSNLSTSVYGFIQEYLNAETEEVINQSRTATQVELTMQLQGRLLKPIINFDIAFPQLTQQLKSYTDSKLRLLKQDQNELNRQVFGLVVLGQFLPSDFNFQGSELTINTLSELVTSQLSILLTELISEVIVDGDLISGVDFDVSYNYYETPDLTSRNYNKNNEVQLRMKNSLFNDKLSISFGGNLDLNNGVEGAARSNALWGNDFIVEYMLNPDRTLKLRVYQTLEPNLLEDASRLQFGAGLSYRREFDTFKEFLGKVATRKKKR